MSRQAQSSIDVIEEKVGLPNGVVVPNRLVKVAMEEGIGWGGGLPSANHRRLYKRWGQGGWGMIVTGNTQVDPRFLATPHDMTFPATASHDRTVASYRALLGSLLSAIPSGSARPLAIVQISHGGLQSSAIETFARLPWVRAVAPCESTPDCGPSIPGRILQTLLWPVKSRRIVSFDEWLEIVEKFVRAAMVLEEAGWDGVQIHSAHGYLLASYLSPLTNPTPQPLPGVPWQIPLRLHLLWLILTGVRKKTKKAFAVGVKINSSDFVTGGLDEEQSTEVIVEMASWGLIDFLEVSGGNYSSPAFAELDTLHHGSKRESLFAHFTRALHNRLQPPPDGPVILLTGGLHSRDLIVDAIQTNACQLAGIGRPACVLPELARKIVLNRKVPDEKAYFGGYKIPGGDFAKRILGGGGSSAPQTSDKSVPVASYLDGEPQVEFNGDGHGPGDVEADERTPLVDRKETAVLSARKGVPLVGAGVSTFWHENQLTRIGRGVEPWMGMGWFFGMLYEAVWWGLLGGGPWGWFVSWRRGDYQA